MNQLLENIKTSLQAIKTEAYGENRPHIIRKHVDAMVSAYMAVTCVDLSGPDRGETLDLLAAVASIKRFIDMNELHQVAIRLPSMVTVYI